MIEGKASSRRNDDDDDESQANEFGFASLELLHSTVELSANTFFRSSLLFQSVFE